MIIEFKNGKVIANQFEVVVRLNGENMVTMQSQVDAIELISGANVITANGSECKWSVKLDNENQLQQLSQEVGIDIR
ncbi:DUF3389 domain-containing protein [Vibrio hannami]|uniref:DUF3389 domain-containing protein n=1 Tax=Vibrio hannami TaxID=2717094 RepID=UPI002410256E|nr:DUF3389 domain-containing protein [Vibrio hannami]MDG3085432.1 DUF3389 domain-containing protein [Vibrio hannami]